MKHPEKWYIPVTEENREELQPWWQEQVRKSGWGTGRLYEDRLLLSEHPKDSSYYWSGDLEYFTSLYPSYQEITLEQFRQITNSNQTQTTMTKQIQISRELLNEYYEAATSPQRAYLSEHFKLDGRTTDEAIRGLHELACSTWKPKIKKNHPDCFPEESKYFDFSRHASKPGQEKRIVSEDVCKSLGLDDDHFGFIQIRNNPCNPQTNNRSFYLDNGYNWELKQDDEAMVLIPTKKQPE
jgi:hypothetical protein